VIGLERWTWVIKAGLAMTLLVATGCASGTYWAADSYYRYGPEAALADLDSYPRLADDICLDGMERAMIYLELGRYREVEGALSECDRLPTAIPGEPDRVYRGEPHERVLRETVRVLALLALQDDNAAGGAAPQILQAIVEAKCPACVFGLSRWVAALGLEAAGQLDEAELVLAEAVSESPQNEFLAAELERAVVRGRPVEGFAPPPRGGVRDRDLVLVLLLGRGPRKVSDDGFVGVEGPSYEAGFSETPQAGVQVDGEIPVRAVELTDMTELGQRALESRRAQGLAPGETGLGWILRNGTTVDLRCWSSLPEIGSGLRVSLPETTAGVRVGYGDADGNLVDSEEFTVPEGEWTGSMVVVRRIP
jgi:hypothetical protein